MDSIDPKAIFPRFYAIFPRTGNTDVTLSGDDSPVESPFSGDLVILYGHDRGNYYELVSGRQLRELGITKDELHRIAVDNLTGTDKEIRLHHGEGYSFIICDGNLEASLLLHEGIWEFVGDQLKGDILAAIPARDLLILGGITPKQVSALKRKACECLEHADRPLSSRLLLRKGDGWIEYPT